jgi:hypothetical protein
MNKVLIITGCVLGVLFSIWDSMMNYADSAPIDNEFGIEIISGQFFTKKTLMYMLIGFILGWILFLVARKVIKKKI